MLLIMPPFSNALNLRALQFEARLYKKQAESLYVVNMFAHVSSSGALETWGFAFTDASIT